jgi:uncharacterized protein (TIGR00661 family)
MKGWELHYSYHSFDLKTTLLKNVGMTLEVPRILRTLNKSISKQDYDLAIVDYGAYTSILGKINHLPIISIDHQHSLIHPDAKMPEEFDIAKIAMMMSIYIAAPFYDYYIAFDYIDSIKRAGNGTLHPLLWKSEFDYYDIYSGEHICVYLTHIDRGVVEKHLKRFPQVKFVVYGFNINETLGNITYKKTSRKGFLTDFCSSKGIISNSGFSITWEASIVGKPIYIIPHKAQFEQIVNTYRLKEFDHVVSSLFLNTSKLKQFIDLVEKFSDIEIKTKYTSVKRFYKEFEYVVNKL